MTGVLACNPEAAVKGAHTGCPVTPPSWVERLPDEVLWAADHVYLLAAVLLLAAVAWVALPVWRARGKTKPGTEAPA